MHRDPVTTFFIGWFAESECMDGGLHTSFYPDFVTCAENTFSAEKRFVKRPQSPFYAIEIVYFTAYIQNCTGLRFLAAPGMTRLLPVYYWGKTRYQNVEIELHTG
jgi:hypothetical protein